MNKPIGLNFGHPFTLVIETQSQHRFPLPPFVAFQETPTQCFPSPPFVAFQETPRPTGLPTQPVGIAGFPAFQPTPRTWLARPFPRGSSPLKSFFLFFLFFLIFRLTALPPDCKPPPSPQGKALVLQGFPTSLKI
jgi:hypothetical protein